MQMKELLLVSRRLNPHRVTSIGDGDLTDFYLHALHLKVFTFIFIELKLNIFFNALSVDIEEELSEFWIYFSSLFPSQVKDEEEQIAQAWIRWQETSQWFPSYCSAVI